MCYYEDNKETNLRLLTLKFAHTFNDVDEGNTYSKNIKQLVKLLTISKKNLFVCMYKMVNITKETYESNGIEVITGKFGELWLNERHVQQQLEIKNLPALTNKYNEEYKKCRYKLIDDPIK